MMHPGTYRDAFGPHLPAVDRLPFGDVSALEAALAAPDVAAIVVEPIQIEEASASSRPNTCAALRGDAAAGRAVDRR